jgi:uncharacterized protein YxjI
MRDILGRNTYLVKEHVGALKAASSYDIFDPETGAPLLVCREESLGWITRALRFTEYKRMTPFDVQVRTPDGATVLRVRRGVSLLRSKVEVLDEHEQPVGGFQQKLLSIGGRFDVHDRTGSVVCTLQGKWTGWDFRFLAGQRELARVTKKWAGVGKELFTSADNYVLQIADDVAEDDPVRMLILGAILCIDLVLKE